MKTKIVYIERKFWEFVSIEKVFRQIAKGISGEKYEYGFEQLGFGNDLAGVIRNLIFYKIPEADLLHITGHVHYMALRLPSKKTILTIHDLGFLHTNKGLKRYLLKKLFLDLPVKKLKFVTTISEATRDEIVFHTNCDINKIRVIENPLSDIFQIAENKKFNNTYPRILQIGSTPNKNVLNLIRALKGIPCKLDIVGRLDSEQMDLLKEYKIDFENSFNLNDAQIVEKYTNADILAFCSTFEGFGLPIIEAQAMRTPVITSDLSPLKEVAGNGALKVDPYKVKDIRMGLKKIIGEKNFREQLVLEGLVNVQRFKSDQISAKYQDLYEEVLNKNT